MTWADFGHLRSKVIYCIFILLKLQHWNISGNVYTSMLCCVLLWLGADRRWTGSALDQIMACRLDGTKPLSEPMLTYCQLDPKEHISMKFYLKFKYFHMRKCIWTCDLQNGSHFVQGRWVNPNFSGLPLWHWGNPMSWAVSMMVFLLSVLSVIWLNFITHWGLMIFVINTVCSLNLTL